MTAVEIKWQGRLGNQLFQYAALRGLAPTGWRPARPGPVELLTAFEAPQLRRKLAQRAVPSRKLVYKEPGFAHSGAVAARLAATGGRAVVLDGFFQSARYWEPHATEAVRRELTFKPQACAAAAAALGDPEVVALHVRRGDYVENPCYAQLGGEYFAAALEEHFPGEAEVVVVSDDPDWCREHLPWRVVEGGSAAADLCILALCRKGVVMSNSSFSWWGAYLGERPGRTVVCPSSRWFAGPLAHFETSTIARPGWRVA